MTGVLVTGAGPAGVGEQLVKSLLLAVSKGSKYRIYGADSGFLNESELEGWIRLRLPSASDENYVGTVIEYARRYGISAILPGSEPELLTLVAHRAHLRSHGISLLANNKDTIDLCRNKFALNEELKTLGFGAPRAVVLKSHSDFSRVDFFPVVLKPNLGGRGSNDVFIVQDSGELSALASYLQLGVRGRELIAQEYVGVPEAEFTIGVLSDLDGEIIDSIAVKKDLSKAISVKSSVENRTASWSLGSRLVISSGISQGVVGKYVAITQQAERIAKAVSSSGPLNIQARLVGETIYVFEINPRYSGTSYFRSLAGMNESDLMIRRHILGEDVPRNLDWPKLRIERLLVERLMSD